MLKLKVRKFWGIIITFVEVTRENLVGGRFRPAFLFRRIITRKFQTCGKKFNLCFHFSPVQNLKYCMETNDSAIYIISTDWSPAQIIWSIYLSKKVWNIGKTTVKVKIFYIICTLSLVNSKTLRGGWLIIPPTSKIDFLLGTTFPMHIPRTFKSGRRLKLSLFKHTEIFEWDESTTLCFLENQNSWGGRNN